MDVLTFGESMVVFSPNINGPLRHVHTFPSHSVVPNQMSLLPWQN